MKPALLLLVAAMATAATATERGGCKLELMAAWQVRENYHRPVIDGAINGQKVGILLDTGATSSLIQRAAAARLGLKTFWAADRSFGIGGETRVEGTDIEELRIGSAVRRGWRAKVVGEHDFGGDVALLLGDDFFRQLDVEFDLPANAVRLFQAKACDGAWLGYWAKDAMAVPLESLAKIHVSVQVNGRSVLALLDSGAGLTTLTTEAAHELGVTPQTPGVVAGGCIGGLGKERYESWIGTFESFAIGEEIIRNPRLRFAPMWHHMREAATGTHLRRRMSGLPDMLLGADFLRAHRVFIAHSQRRMYFTYAGGPVFPVTPRKPCSENQTK